ncbi:PIG-P-domain-containing protein [Daedaleopsis nitida]|nr:PIG-P-domain-containing protein [Daedaleopsis nitida]
MRPSRPSEPDSDSPEPKPAPATAAAARDTAGTNAFSTGTSTRISSRSTRTSTHSDIASDTPSDADAGADEGVGSDLSPSIGSDAFVPEPGQEPPTSPTAPLAPYPPLSPTDSRSRAPEFYGFVAWTSTYLLFVLYLLWAFLPDEHILALGVAWYPNREWSLLVPAYGMVLVLLTYFTYFALALAGTPSFSDLRTITDSKAHFPAPAAADGDEKEDESGREGADRDRKPRAQQQKPRTRTNANANTDTNTSASTSTSAQRNVNPYRAHARPDAIPELYDIPLGMVNRVVYGPPRPRRTGDGLNN